MTVIDPTRRGLLGALLGLAFGWELIESLSAASPLYHGAPIGGALGDAWPAIRLALHAVAATACLIAIGQLLNKTYRRIWPVVYGLSGVAVHIVGSSLQLSAIRMAKAQGSVESDALDGLLLAVGTTSVIGCVLPLTTLVLGWKTPNTEDPPPKLPAIAGLVALAVFGGMGYRAFVVPENALAEFLITGDDDEKLHAAIRLAERKPETIPALDALSQTLAAKDDKLARAASLALKRAQARGIAPAKRALGATSPIVRVRAVEVLRIIGERASTEKETQAAAAAALAPTLADENAKVRAAGIEGLRRIGIEGTNALIAGFSDPKAKAAHADLESILLALGIDDAAVAVHRRRLAAPQATVRFVAARELMRLGPKATAAAPDLVGRIVATEEPQVKSAAASALRAIGADAHPPIDRALTSATGEVASLLQYAKGEGDAPDNGSVSVIPAGANPVAFLTTLVDTKAATVAQVPGLAALVADIGEASDVRAKAAQALMGLGTKAKESTFVLEKARREFDAKVAQAATNAYLVVAPTKTADVAAELASPYEPRRLLTARALRHTVLAREEVATSLSIALVDAKSSVRAAAAESLGTFGQTAAHVLPALESAKDDDDAFVRAKANEAYDLIVAAQ